MKSFYEQAIEFYSEGETLKDLEIISESESFVQGDRFKLDFLEADIFLSLGEDTENPKKKLLFLMSSMECFLRMDLYNSAYAMFSLAEMLGSVSFYKKSRKIALGGLKKIATISEELDENGFYRKEKEKLESLIQKSRIIVESKTCVPCHCEQEPEVTSTRNLAEALEEAWNDSSAEIKRSFMKVSTQEFRLYVSTVFGNEGRDALEQVFGYAKKNEKWKLWLCRSCSKKFSTSDECARHLVQEHGAEFKPSSRNDMAQRVSEVWAGKVSVGVWKPIDAETAVEMMKTGVEYEDGWCNEWPFAEDEERSRVLNGVRSLLVSLCNHKVLSERTRGRMVHAVGKQLGQLGVSKQTVTGCRLLETPKSICFLECGELNLIFDLLSGIKLKPHDGIDLVCSAVDSFCGGARSKEKIDFDLNFSFLLLDKRLLQGTVDGRFDEEGKIRFTDPNVHCAKIRGRGDAFLSWLADSSSGDERFEFPRNIKAHNLDIWKAALRAIQFTCTALGTKYAMTMKLLSYGAALHDVKELCIRSNLQEDQLKSLLRSRCEEGEAGNLFLCAVRDVLNGASCPTLEGTNPSDDDEVSEGTNPSDDDEVSEGTNPSDDDEVSEGTNPSDDAEVSVMKSIEILESVVNNKVALIDSEILVIDKSRIDLLKSLTSLCVFDYQSYIHPPLKDYVIAQMAARFF